MSYKKQVLIVLLCLISCASNYIDNRAKSPHFKDGIFHNYKSGPKKNWFDIIKLRLTADWADWPDWVKTKEVKSIEPRVNSEKIKITFINHASFLIQTGGLNILTDPIYSERCSPVSFAGPKRVHKPGIDFKKLPKIDLVIISHDHYDHLDLDTIENLVKRDNPKLFMGLGVGERIDFSYNVFELDWWQSKQPFESLKLSFVPVQHFSGRSLTDKFSTLWGAYVLEISGKKIYFGGDSGYADHYKQTFEKFGPMDISLLPIGAYAPRSFMAYVHMDPKQAIQAHIDLGSKLSIGMHYGTFQLTAEKINDPITDLRKEKKAAKVKEDDFITLELGKTYTF